MVVKPNGEVISQFEIKSLTDNKNRIYKVGSFISNIEHLLRFYLENVAHISTKENIESILDSLIPAFERKDGNKFIHGSQIIGYWRNSSLHGEENYSTIGGIILSIMILLELESLESNFENIHTEAVAKYNFYGKSKKSSYYHLFNCEFYEFKPEWLR